MAAQESNGAPRRRPAKAAAEKKPLPYNAGAEASILGGVILRNALLAELDTLETADFNHYPHQVVWEAIRNLAHAQVAIDVTTLEVEIERRGKLDAIGGPAFLGQLVLHVPTVDNVLAYARSVRDLSLLRKIALRASRAVERAKDWPHEVDELLGETIADMQKLERDHRAGNEALPTIGVRASLDEIARLAATPIFATPFPALNEALGFGGLLGGQVYYLAGGTGFGKTSFVATLIRAHAETGRPATIAFYEMFAGYYTARMAAPILGVHANRILRGEIDRGAIERALPCDRIEMLEAPTMQTLRRLAERHVREGRGAPLIVVDYVQLLGERILATMPRPDARLANSQASAGLRELAKETGSAVIAVSAAGRAASKRLSADVRKSPARELVDASKESGAIEFDGAGVIVLSVSDEKDGDENVATISVAKARFGETRHCDARYAGRTGAWREIGIVATVPKIVTPPDDGAVRAAIVRVLTSCGPLASKTQIWKLSGKNKPAVLSEIDAMIGGGALIVLEGKYALPGADSTPVQTSLPDPVSEVTS